MLRLLPIHRAIHWFEWPRTRLLWLWTKMSACDDWSFCMSAFPRNWSSTHSWINVFKLWLGARCCVLWWGSGRRVPFVKPLLNGFPCLSFCAGRWGTPWIWDSREGCWLLSFVDRVSHRNPVTVDFLLVVLVAFVLFCVAGRDTPSPPVATAVQLENAKTAHPRTIKLNLLRPLRLYRTENLNVWLLSNLFYFLLFYLLSPYRKNFSPCFDLLYSLFFIIIMGLIHLYTPNCLRRWGRTIVGGTVVIVHHGLKL